MKQTEFDGKQYLLDLLNQSGIKNVINGAIYKNRRPAESTKEDIVINALSVDNEFLQDGVFNVNFYVPYQKVSINGVQQYMPNEARMKQIINAAYPIFDNVFGENFNLTIVRTEVFEEDSDNTNYINLRINVKFYNNGTN